MGFGGRRLDGSMWGIHSRTDVVWGRVRRAEERALVESQFHLAAALVETKVRECERDNASPLLSWAARERTKVWRRWL